MNWIEDRKADGNGPPPLHNFKDMWKTKALIDSSGIQEILKYITVSKYNE